MDFGIAIKFSQPYERVAISASSNHGHGTAPGTSPPEFSQFSSFDHLTTRAGERSTVVHCASGRLPQRLVVP